MAAPLASSPRNCVIAALVGGLIAVGGGWLAGGERAQQVAIRQAAATELQTLGSLAGLRSADGRGAALHTLPVAVDQEGGPLWIHDEVETAVEDDPAFVLADGPHRVRAEVVGVAPAFALRLSLLRQGWSLQTSAPRRVRVAPLLAILGGLAGAAVLGALTRRLGWAVALSGLMTQVLVGAMGWPDPLGAQTLRHAWRTGPLGEHLVRWARAVPDSALTFVLFVAVLSGVLVVIDHRRSARRGGWMLASGLAGVFGGLLWLEAAGRTALFAWGSTAWGWVALLGLTGAWTMAVLGRRSAGKGST